MNIFKLSLVAGTALALAACGSEADSEDSMMADESAMAEEATAPGTIVDMVVIVAIVEVGRISVLCEAFDETDDRDTKKIVELIKS